MGKYSIKNPYETVDWNTWGHYKANLHTHSNASDSKVDYADMIEAHYERGFDILSMTDHGVVDMGWNRKPRTIPLLSYRAILKKPRYLTEKRFLEISDGTGRGGRGMIGIPFGIELNPSTASKCHVNGYFTDYGQGKWGKENDYQGPIAKIEALGGLSVINHPGDWLGSSKDINKAKNPRNIAFFAGILKSHSSCLGIEVLNGYDLVTRHDRVLWDGLLESVIPSGRFVWGFANSDAHLIEDIDTGFNIFMMPENNLNNIRKAMESGTFFACSRIARPELGEDFKGKGDYPSVSEIVVDENAGQITVRGENYDRIEWISKGEVIAAGNTLDLDAYKEQIGGYVRARLIGPGGICFTQAFAVDYGSASHSGLKFSSPPDCRNYFTASIKNMRAYVLIKKAISRLS